MSSLDWKTSFIQEDVTNSVVLLGEKDLKGLSLEKRL